MTYIVRVSIWLRQEGVWLPVCELTEVPPREITECVEMFNKVFLTSVFDYKITLAMEVTSDA